MEDRLQSMIIEKEDALQTVKMEMLTTAPSPSRFSDDQERDRVSCLEIILLTRTNGQMFFTFLVYFGIIQLFGFFLFCFFEDR